MQNIKASSHPFKHKPSPISQNCLLLLESNTSFCPTLYCFNNSLSKTGWFLYSIYCPHLQEIAGGSEAVIQIMCYSEQNTIIKYVTYHMSTAFTPPISSHHILLKVISSILKLCETGQTYNKDGFKLTVINYMEENGNHTLFLYVMQLWLLRPQSDTQNYSSNLNVHTQIFS